MSLTMPSLKNYQCRLCTYVAHNSRMLARHVVIVHSEKVFRCPICPFVTRYAANWYRHKRAQHGLAKVPTCEVCGFFANSIAELAQHREAIHHKGQLQRDPFANPFARETQERTADNDPYSFQLSPPRNTIIQDHNVGVDNTKEPATSTYNNYQNVPGENVPTSDSVTFSLPLDGNFLENDLNLTQPVSQFKIQPHPPPNMTSYNGDTTNLSPLKIRRTYCCDLCGFVTGSPREFLYHQRDFHGVKMNIFECELCIYASKHIQKLQRHYGLVHRQKKTFDTSSTSAKQAMDGKSVSVKSSELSFTSKPSSIEPQVPSAPVPKPPKPKREKPGLLKCPACSYHTRNKVLMTHHEKTVHYKKRFYHCYQCVYVTTEKGQYTKHIKYHNAAKMQCEFCHFKSAYKWNMDRHLRNHMTGTKGEYNCTLCNFVTHSKQSLKFHSQNHHQFETMDGDDSVEIDQDPSITDKPEQLEDVDSNWMNAGADDFETIDDVANLDPDSVENSSTGWDLRPTSKPQNLKCGTCNFITTWPFELKKHEEMHKSDKKHSCPLCGMGFEHIAWLTKHLHRVHSGNAQAQSIAAAYELLKPVRRRRPNDNFSRNSTPVYHNSSDQSASKIKKPGAARQSLLSSYLRSPVPKYPNAMPKAKLTAKPPQTQYNFSMPSVNQNAIPKKRTFKRMNSCKKCNYKTKWISELEKHMRVHNDEKPFHCHKCNYHSRWKGDLTRHIAKYHGCKLPISNKSMPLPKLKLKKAMQQQISQNNWENVSEDTTVVNNHPRNSNAREQQDSPLDLTMSRFNIFQPASHSRINGFRTDIVTRARRETCYDQNSTKTNSNSSYLNMLLTSDKSEPQPKNYTNAPNEGTPRNGKKKYFCPFCAFNTSTASRFHVHVVQHYNKRPFMCSSCGHRSNWEWDITKHIRVKGCKDKDHNSACVLLTDETGRRNYEKYDKYLRDVDPKPRVSPRATAKPIPSPPKAPEELRDNTYGFMTPSNSVNVSEEAPENIIVTPDLPFSQDMTEKLEAPNPNDQNWNENSEVQNGNFKFFLCKHCKYKHSSKKVVISHLSVHAGVRPFRCRVCGLTSSWRNVIVQHIKTAHNGYMNDVEDRITYVQEGFVIRITSVKSNKYSGISAVSGKAMFNCKLCPYKCDKEVYIKFHMKQHKQREGAIYQCSFCPYFVKFKRTLVRHMKLHEAAEFQEDSSFQDPNISEMNTQQPIIDTTYSVPEYNDVYEQNEPQDEYPETDSIQIAYSQLQDSNSYDQHESGAYNQSCGSTNSYGQTQDSSSHYVDEQTAKRKRHVCENCPYRTDNRTQYLYHKQFHRPNASAPFKCSICSYWASMQHLLTQHMKVHRDNPIENLPEEEMAYPSSPEHNQSTDSTDISPVYVQRGGLVTKMFQCRYCPMMNKKRANVRVHERMHGETTNDGKFTCSLCSYKCLGQGSLTNHMKMHHGGGQVNQIHNKTKSSFSEQPGRKKVFSYFCLRCPAVFKSSSDLYIHKTFHGSTLPFPCPQCDYRAKHRIHLQKHLQVHTEAYVLKRDASCGPPVVPANNNKVDHAHPAVKSMSTKKIDQMLLLELAEVKSFIRNPKVKGREKCKFCPAAFAKIPILTYHLLLHGSTGEFGCSHCDYATTRSTNLAAHVQLHSKMSNLTKRPPPKAFNCPKCPAVFDKNDRFERHFNLHGKNQRYVCEHCDYSVRYAANLVKHRKVHQNTETVIPHSGGEEHDNENNVSNDLISSILADTTEPHEGDVAQADLSKSPDNDEEKKMYLCQRCPYIQPRKDAVQNHQNRHWQKGGLHCPYCDYRVMGLVFLQNHVRSHVTPVDALSPHMYLKFENVKIIEREDGNEIAFFEDKGPDVELIGRFVPVLSKDDILVSPERNSESDTANESLNEDKADSNSDTDESLDEDVDVTETGKDSEDSMSANVVKFSSSALKEVPPEYLPSVVLTNILPDNKDTVQLDNMVIKKTAHHSYQIDNINKLSGKKFKSSIKSYSATTSIQNETPTTKSSLIVKIKVENVMEDNNEKSLYSISSRKPEQIQSVPDETTNNIEEYTIDDLTPPATLSDIEICDDSIDTSVEIETTHDFKSFTANNDEQNVQSDDNEILICETPSQKQVIGQDSVSNTEVTQANDILKQLNSMVNGVCVDSVKA